MTNQERILLIGGPEAAELPLSHDFQRIGCDMPSILSAPDLYDFDSVIFWPNSFYLNRGKPEDWDLGRARSSKPPPHFWTIPEDLIHKKEPPIFIEFNWHEEIFSNNCRHSHQSGDLKNNIGLKDALLRTRILELRCFERLHEIISGAVHGAVSFVVANGSRCDALSWISPSLTIQPADPGARMQKSGIKSLNNSTTATMLELVDKIVTTWNIDFLLCPQEPDYPLERLDTTSISGDPNATKLNWRTLLQGVTRMLDEFKELTFYNCMFGDYYFQSHDALTAELTLIRSHMGRNDNAKSLVFSTGCGAIIAIPEPTSLKDLVDGIRRRISTEAHEMRTSCGLKEDHAPSREATTASSEGHTSPDMATVKTAELQQLHDELKRSIPQEIEHNSGGGRRIRPNDVKAMCAALCTAHTRSALCISLYGSNYKGSKIDELKKKLRNTWMKKPSLSNFSTIALKIVDKLVF